MTDLEQETARYFLQADTINDDLLSFSASHQNFIFLKQRSLFCQEMWF